jgi:AbrB family looped-hinge helix DNA binding protein
MKATPTQERLGRVGPRRQIVIPRKILATLDLRAGDLVAFAEQENGVLIKPKRAVDPDDVSAFEEDPFRGLVKPLKGKEHRGKYRKVSGRYRIIFKPIHTTRTVEVLAILLRNEKTYR